jgi:hypothetical protein
MAVVGGVEYAYVMERGRGEERKRRETIKLGEEDRAGADKDGPIAARSCLLYRSLCCVPVLWEAKSRR